MALLVPLLAALLLAAGCGGDQEEPVTSERTVTSDPTTVEAFIAELRPDKQATLEALVADSDACKGVKVDPGFVLLVTSKAIEADQQGPLADLVEEQC